MDPVNGGVLILRGADGAVLDRRSVRASTSLVRVGDDLVVASIRYRTLTRLPLVRNVTREVHLGDLMEDPAAWRAAPTHLGDAGRGAGDPSSLLADARGRFVVTPAGTDELLIPDPSSGEEQRHPVGHRPVAALASADGRVVAVANSLDGSIS
ncbi:MAG: hypothetical protein E2O39_14585 [Planctomycetota bacterium]|nr:MAG: hypothetical protein E2O39_14585 [Planctomycetota bacterium]